ncbi:MULTISPECIES: hypothetical protein [unclassified Actinoplanes]|uniref:hypothetical protein n=1 Tax=unclassified Actinoplanes TaxID=2626549 RepID=UPI00043A38B9|nr:MULTISPECIES: hypothetical protein [unclassified Actinoplanes]
MSVPGNTVILLVLLSAFVGCVGYALGRWHERREGGADRAEAYRDGYDHAARSVFSMAARVAGRRRGRGAVRASAVVSPPDPSVAPVSSSPAAPAPVSAPASAAAGPVAVSGMPQPVSTGASAEAPLAGVPSSGVPSSGVAASGGPAAGVSFPAPEPIVVPGLPEPAAEGGVHYSSLPDPRWGAEETVSPPPVPRARHYVSTAGETDTPAPREGAGRHTVPDELVQAATYKLAADRVARARVPRSSGETTDPSESDQGGRPSVPRPRGL